MNIHFHPQSELKEKVLEVCNAATKGNKFIMHTSGTTGIPKTIYKDLNIALQKKKKGISDEKWVLTYSPGRWAGISVVLHVVKSDAVLYVPKSLQFPDIIETSLENKPTHISLTPSMFRSLLLNDKEKKLSQIPIKQITFGGESSAQSVLNLAKKTWPDARVTHVYASTEVGDICAVSDGLEGIPAYKFKKHTFSDIGELTIGDHPTGDIWELKGDRYYFIGRIQEVINVGGNKVSPLEVEEFAVNNGAEMARAFPVPSPVTGFLVGLDYVGKVDEKELLKKYRNSFPKYAWPAKIKKVLHLAISDAGKMIRRQS